MRKTKVLFVCTNNSARSQMAEALLRKYTGESYEVYSAGMDLKGIHPMTVKVLEEIGLDISNHYSKSLKEYMGKIQFDEAIILCRRAEDGCPTVNADARRTQRWLFDNPARADGNEQEKLVIFRQVRDQIEARLKLWLAETAEAEWVR